LRVQTEYVLPGPESGRAQLDGIGQQQGLRGNVLVVQSAPAAGLPEGLELRLVKTHGVRAVGIAAAKHPVVAADQLHAKTQAVLAALVAQFLLKLPGVFRRVKKIARMPQKRNELTAWILHAHIGRVGLFSARIVPAKAAVLQVRLTAESPPDIAVPARYQQRISILKIGRRREADAPVQTACLAPDGHQAAVGAQARFEARTPKVIELQGRVIEPVRPPDGLI